VGGGFWFFERKIKGFLVRVRRYPLPRFGFALGFGIGLLVGWSAAGEGWGGKEGGREVERWGLQGWG